MSKSNDSKVGGSLADRIRKLREQRSTTSSDSGDTRPHEKRLPREPVFASATLVLASGKLAAVVKNVNAVGGRVDFTAHVTLQGDVVIVSPALGLNNRVRVAWQQGGSAGLVFVKRDEGAV